MYYESTLAFTRRDIARLALGAVISSHGRVSGAGSDFWNRKEPKDWSEQEIDRLITNSPWAKEVTPQLGGPGGFGRPPGPPEGEDQSGPSGGPGGQPHGGWRLPGIGPIGKGPAGGAPEIKGIVRWESAQPVIDALKSPIPDAFSGRYVISVNGFPMFSRGGAGAEAPPEDELLNRVKQLTFLVTKNGKNVQPGIIQQEKTTGNPRLLVGFAKDLLALSMEDKDVLFTTHLGPFSIKAKFNLKEMKYRGVLAV